MTATTFLTAIRAAPGDARLRLAWADWLEARDPARAAFIRDQCRDAAAADIGVAGGTWVTPNRDHPASELLRRHEAAWVGPAVAGVEYERSWRLGGVDFVAGPLAGVRRELPGLLRREPVQTVQATDREPVPVTGTAGDFAWYFCREGLPRWPAPAVAAVRRQLPLELVPAFRDTGYRVKNRPGDTWVAFPTRALAVAALSAALLAEARLAGGQL